MRRSSMIASGAALGAAAVMLAPTPGKPQQVLVAGNAAAAGTGGATAASATAGGGHRARSKKSPPSASKPAASAAPSTVIGSLQTTQYGQLQVKLTVNAGRITRVGFTTLLANDGRSVGIDQSAVPILIRETIAAQSANIQGVSGATYTTGAYEQSLQAAIDKAALHA
jgi:uncharacterized protein with FMN-binding domain